MIVKVLGVLDIFVAVVFWLFGMFGLVSESFILLLGLILLVKGLVFAVSLNITSVLDVVSALLIITATAVTMPVFVVALVTLFLLQKGAFSLFG